MVIAMKNEQILKNMNKIEDILIHSFGDYPYTEEEQVLLTSLDKAVEVLRKQSETKSQIETNIYDIEEIHTNCTVQILTNSITGETSVGWWKND